MSVSDPAIKDLKACILKFLEDKSGKIDDDHRSLSSFCQKIENIFYGGLRNTSKYFTSECEPYEWMSQILKDQTWNFSFHYFNSFYEIENNGSLMGKLGKFRLLLRYSLVHKCLHVPLEYLVKKKKTSHYYLEHSVMGDEILSEILLSVFLLCGKIHFDLDLSNIYFLETTWLLPDVQTIELVPNQTLGLAVTFSDEKAVIVGMDSCGPAAENGQIEIGDILQSINGIQINSSSRGKLNRLMKKCRSHPLNVTIVKALKASNKNTLYIPIRKYLLDVGLDVLTIQNNRIEGKSEQKSREILRDGFRCIYLGYFKVGTEGDSRQIEKTIRDIIKNRHKLSEKSGNGFNKHAYIQVGELGVKIVDPDTGEVNFSHSYMDISSCGGSHLYPNYFGYVKGNDLESPFQFTCFIFHARNTEDIAMILSSLGQGFKRTAYAV